MNEIIRRRRLPHWDVPDATYFVTSCLEGSIPAQGWEEIHSYDEKSDRCSRPSHLTEAEWKIFQWKRRFTRLENWLDLKPAIRHLADDRLAKEVIKAMFHFAGLRYDLLAFVVMPSHIHWAFQPRAEWAKTVGPLCNRPVNSGRLQIGPTKVRTPRECIVQSLNRYSASACNVILERQGTFWQHESYDHWIRDVDELDRIIQYIEGNPVKANLVSSPEDWPFSSACMRIRLGLEYGQPLILPRGADL